MLQPQSLLRPAAYPSLLTGVITPATTACYWAYTVQLCDLMYACVLYACMLCAQMWWLRSADDMFTIRLGLIVEEQSYAPHEPIFKVMTKHYQ
jgi:hypothetical protein